MGNPGRALQSYCCTSWVGMAVTQGNDLGLLNQASLVDMSVVERDMQHRSHIFSP